ncbi:MAG: hypothetical protein O7B99_07310 [Planctomycetota bacterium]|nr:hypothetical protein [Planctomycetota bacterium]
MNGNGRISALALAAFLGLGACSTAPKEPDPLWVEAEVEAGSDRLLWKLTLLSLNKMNFPEGSEMDPTNMRVVSGWKNELSPWKSEGFREQAEVNCVPVGPGRWRVEARIKRQTNESLTRPLDLRYAEWEWAPDNEMGARILLQHIRSFLGPSIELSEDEKSRLERMIERNP